MTIMVVIMVAIVVVVRVMIMRMIRSSRARGEVGIFMPVWHMKRRTHDISEVEGGRSTRVGGVCHCCCRGIFLWICKWQLIRARHAIFVPLLLMGMNFSF